jgi:membrane-associated phospholipid phosphatase
VLIKLSARRAYYNSQFVPPVKMSLLGRPGLDTTSWAKSLRASSRIILTCVIGIILAWLILRVVAPSADSNIVTALYNSTSGDTSLLIIYGIATVGDLIWVPLVFWLYVFRKDSNEWTSSLILAVAMVTAMSLTDVLKTAFNLPRPFQAPSLGIKPRGEIPTNPGFPSGHTTNAFTIATMIWYRYPAWRVPFTALAVTTGVSMIILGLHFPSDVIGGAFLGVFSGTFVLGLAKLRSSK